MTLMLTAFNGDTIWIRGDVYGIHIGIFGGRSYVAHDIIELTPTEAIKFRKAIDLMTEKAIIEMDESIGKMLADLGKEASE